MTHARAVYVVIAAAFLAVLVGGVAYAQSEAVKLQPGESITIEGVAADSDGDGAPDPLANPDNCPDAPNAGQEDKDSDGKGDACDSVDDRPDSDGDGTPDAEDTCEGHSDSADMDSDGIPDGCDVDRDGDGFDNGVDNQPDTYNPQQTDTDGDKIGDFADEDKDGDGYINHEDPAPKDPTIPGDGGGSDPGPEPVSCDVTIATTQDIDAVINADPRESATTFCPEAGTHSVSEPIKPDTGDKVIGVVGTEQTRGPAVYPAQAPATKLVGQGTGATRILTLQGSNVEVAWLDISGGHGVIDESRDPSTCPSSNLDSGCPKVGTGIGIAMGQADGTARVHHVRVHDNDGVGISNAKGRITNSETFSNTDNSAFLGVVGSGIKGITEFEAAYNYVHDEQGNGIWHDHATSTAGNDPEMASNPGGGSWFHHNLVVDSGRWGLRFEYSPRDANEGQHLATPSFMAENNRLAANGNGGASHRDAQNGEWRNNTFGPGTIAGVTYAGNNNSLAIGISDSGRSDRTDLWNAAAHDNTLNGEAIKGCDKPDEVVVCSGNS